MLANGLALLAAALNASASVLQRRAGREAPDRDAFSLRLLFDLLVRPVWLVGIGAVLLGFLVQATALALGDVAVVQPLLVAELPFTLLLAAVVFHTPIHRREWTAIGMMAVGLAAFILTLAPTGGGPAMAPLAAWLVGVGLALAVAGVLVVVGHRARGPRRAALLGIATGVGFGLTAVLVAGVGAAYRHGLLGVATAWQTWAVVVIGPLSFFLLQNALQAGSLVASQPGMTLANPLVAVTWGLTIFSQHARGGWWLAGTVLGTALIGAGTVVLARSPLLHQDRNDRGPTSRVSG